MATRPTVRRLWRAVSVELAAALLIGLPSWADEKPGSTPREERKADANTPPSLEHYRQAAARYEIVLDADPPARLVLHDQPVLHWTNPLRKTDDGAVFLWLSGGRPLVIASFYTYRVDGAPVEDHEFQSLASVGLTASVAARIAWAPREGGVNFRPIPDAPRPAATPALRLRQLRALAREFRAFFDLVENKSELRLLPQPLFRYETKGSEDDDGALFAFVQTTDPEVLLLIESRPLAGAPTWHYGFARMSMVGLRAKHKEQDVWTALWEDDRRNPSKPYVDIVVSDPPR